MTCEILQAEDGMAKNHSILLMIDNAGCHPNECSCSFPTTQYHIYNDLCHAKDSVKQERQKRSSEGTSTLKSVLSPPFLRAMELAQEEGSSSWLSALPLEEYSLTLHKGAFRDALALRYGWTPSNLPAYYACGAAMSVEHALSCPKGGLPIARHNEVRDTVAGWMGKVYNNTNVEPALQLISGEVLRHATAISEEGARLDIAVKVFFWGGGGLLKGRFLMSLCSTPMPQSVPRCHLLET